MEAGGGHHTASGAAQREGAGALLPGAKVVHLPLPECLRVRCYLFHLTAVRLWLFWNNQLSSWRSQLHAVSAACSAADVCPGRCAEDGKQIHIDFGAYADPDMLNNLSLATMREGKKPICPAPLRCAVMSATPVFVQAAHFAASPMHTFIDVP